MIEEPRRGADPAVEVSPGDDSSPWSPFRHSTFTFLAGSAAALISPAWQAVVPQLVPRRELPAAVALNSVGFNVSRAVGPALAGLIIAAMGSEPGVRFSRNASQHSEWQQIVKRLNLASDVQCYRIVNAPGSQIKASGFSPQLMDLSMTEFKKAYLDYVSRRYFQQEQLALS